MSLILVVEQEGRYIERIHDALSSEGWRAKVVGGQPEALRAASSEAPSLVLVNSDLEGAASLYSSFARRNGGPGVIALVPERRAGELTAERLEVDAVLAKPFTDQDLRLVVRRGLAEARQPPSRPAPVPAAEDGDGESRFTSRDIFGDLVAEIEGEIAREQAAATPPGEPAPPAPPPAVPVPEPPAPTPAAPPAAATGKPARDLDDTDLTRRLEETLSGVLSVDRPTAPAAQPPPRRKSRDVDVDALLNETLTGLRLGTLGKDRGAAKPAAPAADKPAPAGGSVSRTGPAEPFGTLDLRERIAGLADRPPAPRPAAPSPAAAPTPPAEQPPGAEVPGPEESFVPEEVVSAAAGEPDAEEATPVFDLSSDQPLLLEPPPLEDLPPPAYAAAQTPAAPASSPPPAAAAPAPALGVGEGDGGQQFGQYALLERIAVGGMAEVWKARMRGVEGFQKTVAIKKILPHLTDNGDFVSMFIDEAKLAAQLSHPNIIHIYDLGKIGENFYIAMEYVEGKNLRAILNAARDKALPMPVDLALLVGARLASALDYAHRKRDFNERELGLVHRDVSPQNVLISYEGDIKLCDFGIAKAVAKASQTQMGALKGKLQYMSPEQAWGRAVDARSDIFSLGSLLFEALTGRRLFVGDNEISVLEAVRECKVEDPRVFNPEVPAEASAIVLSALAKDPGDRYANAGELQHALEQLLYTRRPAPGPADLAAYLQRLSAAKPAPPAEARSAVEVAPAPPAEAAAGAVDAPVEEAAAVPAADDDEVLELPPEVLAPLGGEAPAAGEEPAAEEMFAAGKAIAAEEAGAGTASRAGDLEAGEWTATGSRPGVAAVAPVGAVEVDDAGGRGRWMLIGAILFFVLAGIAAYFYLHTVRGQPPAVPPAAGAVEEEIVTPLPADDGTPSGGEPADTAGEAAPAEEGGAPPVQAGPAPEVGGAAAVPPASDVEKLVDEELARREREIRRELDAKERQLQDQLQKAKTAEPAPAGETAKPPGTAAPAPANGKPAAEPAATAEPSRGPPAQPAPATPPAAGAAAGSTSSSSAASSAAAAPATTTAEPERAAARPEPASPPASAASEPARPEPDVRPPKVKVGELVEPGPGVTPPKLVSIQKPEYPPLARKLQVEGDVVLAILVSENGEALETRIVEQISQRVGINEAAIAAARTARFEPATKDGVRVKMWTTLRLPFRL